MTDPIDAYRKARDLPPLSSKKFSFASVRLVLFDIDGTLLGGCAVHGQSILTAISQIAGRNTNFQGIDVSGRPDRAIITAVLDREFGAVAPEVIDSIMELTGKLFLEVAAEGDVVEIPGARGFLEALKKRKILTGLLTGNIEAVAWRKMELAGFRHHFSNIGGFGQYAAERIDLLPLAIVRALHAGHQIKASEILIVGDTPRDVEVANTHGCQIIGVTTGKYTKRDLQMAGADTIVSNLIEAMSLLET